MIRFKMYARTAVHAQISLCLLIAFLMLQTPSSVAHTQDVLQIQSCHGSVTVVADHTWQTSYPQCTVQVVPLGLGKTPTVSVNGGNCYPAYGTVTIAKVYISYAEFDVVESYTIAAVDGIVEVDLIDPM